MKRLLIALGVSLAVAPAGGCLESELPEGVYRCEPGAPELCPEGWICRPVTCPAEYRCYRRDPGERETYPTGCVEDGYCDREACESCTRCPGDCCPTCDVATLAALPPAEYIVSEYLIPRSASEGQELGLDLDGDGEVDNKLGGIVSLAASQGEMVDPNADIRALLATGELMFAGRVFVDDFAQDNAEILLQLLPAQVDEATPLFDGQDVIALAPDADEDAYLCGVRREARLESNPSAISVELPLPMDWSRGELLWLPVERVSVAGGVRADGWTRLILGGGISQQSFEERFYPWWAALLNERIAADPGGGSATDGLQLLDGECVDTYPGCDPIPPGCEEDGIIFADEIRCNALVRSALAPDVDVDGDGELDLVSVGVQLTAVPATIRIDRGR